MGIYWNRTEMRRRGAYVSKESLLFGRSLCAGPGAWDSDHSHFPRRRTDVLDCIFVDCMRHWLYAALRRKECGDWYENRSGKITKMFVRHFKKNFSHDMNKAPR